MSLHFGIKKAECRRIDTFELWCWRRLLRVSWTSRRSKQSILEETNPEYSLEELMLKVKLQYFGHLIWKANSSEKTLMLGKDWGQEETGTTKDEMIEWHHWLNGRESEQTQGESEGQEAWCAAVYRVVKSWIQLSDWTTTKIFNLKQSFQVQESKVKRKIWTRV